MLLSMSYEIKDLVKAAILTFPIQKILQLWLEKTLSFALSLNLV